MDKEILIIIHPHFTIPGGAGKVALEIGKRIAKDLKVVIIAQQINPEYIENYPEIIFESINGPITSSFLFWLLFPVWYFKTAKIIDKYSKQGKIRIFISVFPANWIGLPYKIFHREIRCDWYCHEPSAFIHIKKWRNAISNPLKRALANLLAPIFSAIDKILAKYADNIIANSHYSQNIIEKIYNTKSVVIYPGVDTQQYIPVPFKDKENYILSVGRLTKFKNFNLLIKAFSKLEDKTLSLYIVGNGEEKENLQKLATRLNVQQRVKLLSDINDQQIIDLFAKAKIFVLCSKNEPFGIVPVEAMACGTAVIADNSGGPIETIVSQKTGILVDCNENSLFEAFSELLNDKDKLERFSMEAREHAQRNFDWDLCVTKLRNI